MNTQFRTTMRGLWTGAEFEIVRVAPLTFMQELGDLPIPIAQAIRGELNKDKKDDELAKMTPEQQREAERRTQECMLKHGVKRMRFNDDDPWAPITFWFGPESECPPGATVATDLGADLLALTEAVISFSFKPKGAEALERFFREQWSAIAGHDSATLQQEAVKPVANGNDSGR